MTILRLTLQTPIADHHNNKHKHLIEKMAPNSMQFSARNDAIVMKGVHDVATVTFTKTRKLDSKLDALVNLVTQLAVNQKPSSIARVCGIRSSNDHHTSTTIAAEIRHLIEKMDPNSMQFCARNDAIVIRGVHDMGTDTSAETRKLEGKVDALVNLKSGVDEHPEAYDANTYSRPPNQGVHDVATDTSAETRKLEGNLDGLVNLVTQLAANQKPASVARGCDIRSSNDHHTIVCPSSQQSGMDYHPESYFSARKDTIVISAVHDVATDTSAETRNLEGKLDAPVNLVTELAVNQKPASVARVYDIRDSNDHHTSFSARNDAIVFIGVHDVATDTSAETRKLEGKQDAIVNLVTQLAVNLKHASVARVCGIRSSNGHHTSVCPSSQQSRADEHPEFSARNDAIVIRGVHDLATDTSFETRKLEGKLDALVNLVTQLATNQKVASVARQFNARNDAIVIRGVHDVATDTSAESRKLEGKLDALVNLVTQLAANQKPASVTKVCDIRSSNDHHISVDPSSQQSGVDEHPEISAINAAIVIIGVYDVATDTSAETRKLEGKLDALVNLVTQLAANQKPASVARVCGISSSKDEQV
ncbi:hypothetical protein Fmac_028706 [Flemingia macrophylla]|uniref:Uncharacterized protein n=1 Tax=Flemingia macrophylla TaxID=520843 RepID=A0ABD1L885_9FABA